LAWIDSTPTSNKINAFHDFRPNSIHTPKRSPQNSRRQQGGPDMEFARRDYQTLSRIVAILIALAALAERAAAKPFPVRWIVLAILRQAEAVAAGFVAETMPADWPCIDQFLETGSDPADAMWLAWRFRMLAALLGALLNLACFLDGWNARSRSMVVLVAVRRGPRHFMPRARNSGRNDTS
jgi:hypothetical protein